MNGAWRPDIPIKSFDCWSLEVQEDLRRRLADLDWNDGTVICFGILAQISAEFFEELERRFGVYIHALDWSMHLDESTPHIHELQVFACKKRYGEIASHQEITP